LFGFRRLALRRLASHAGAGAVVRVHNEFSSTDLEALLCHVEPGTAAVTAQVDGASVVVTAGGLLKTAGIALSAAAG
jgi:hypothetical protein